MERDPFSGYFRSSGRGGFPGDRHPIDTRGQYVSGKRDGTQPGRNDPCPCSSGRKWKKCCGGPNPPETSNEEE